MADIGSGVTATKGFFKNHWIAAVVLVVGVIIVALAYDQKSGGKLRSTLASVPLVNKLFT